MRKLILSFALLSLMAGAARAGIVLGTDYSPGTPLTMSAGTTSGPMLIDVISDNFPNDVMAAWQFALAIAPESGAGGTLTFQDPVTPTANDPVSNPPNYIFGSNGFGILATNTGAALSANDTDMNFTAGVAVPGSPGANLLQTDFLASSNASGLFGIYALEGTGNTIWTDPNANTQYFTNVPDGTGMVLIGEVLIAGQSVPEPSSLGMLGLAVTTLTGWCGCRRRNKARVSATRRTA